MTEYLVIFQTKLSAKSEEELREKAEKIEEVMSKTLKKKVEKHGYIELNKKDIPKSILITL